MRLTLEVGLRSLAFADPGGAGSRFGIGMWMSLEFSLFRSFSRCWMAFSCFADNFWKDDDVPVLDVVAAFLALATPSRPRFRDLSAAAEEEDDTPPVGGGGGTRSDEPVSAT